MSITKLLMDIEYYTDDKINIKDDSYSEYEENKANNGCCYSVFNKRLVYSILIFGIWYSINFITLYLLQYYVYEIKINIGVFILLLLLSMNSSLAIFIVLIILFICSVKLTDKIIQYINCDDNYLQYEEL